MTTSLRLWLWKFGLVMIGVIASWENCAYAQITPDSTLTNNSIVTPSGNTSTLEGGTRAGSNLFHSFEQFSVPTGSTADFNNALDIQNIISRVTGKFISNIDGLIKANGNANLFLINPNGIIFGPNARLDVGGSFVGTTANAIRLSNGDFFSANPSEALPNQLLNVNPSAFLFNQINAQAITNEATADSRGLQVPQGRSLLLVGGDVNLEGGRLFAPGGRVELAGVAGGGTVGLNVDSNNLSLSFPDGVPRSDVSLANAAGVNVSAYGGGSIAINARNLDVLGQSFLAAGIVGSGFVDSQAGDITLSATGAMTIADSGIFNAALGAGKGGNLRIDTRQLLIRDGLVATSSNGSGRAGSLTVNASDSVELIGPPANGRTVINTPFDVLNSFNTLTTAPILIDLPGGDAGDLTINTGRLIVRGGATVVSGTNNENQGGDLTIRASDSVELIGTSAYDSIPSALVSGTRGAGSAGNMTIETRRLVVRDGAVATSATSSEGLGGDLTIRASDSVELIGTSTMALSTSSELGQLGALRGVIGDLPFPSGLITGTVGDGKAGDLKIETGRLVIQDGAQASVSTGRAGDAGRLTVRASEVELTGTSKDGYFPSTLQARVEQGSQGNGGDLTIETGQLIVRDRAQVTVSNQGTGTAGNMTLNVRSIRLNNKALLSANTQSARVDPNREQATININSENLIMSRGSNIFTNATGENVIGGNINIDSDFLIAFENSDISANSANFRGGNVRINAQGIFGTQFRDVASDKTSDITATGASPEFSGTVELNTPDTDPNSGLVNLPTVPVDTQVSQACTPGGSQANSEFIVTGCGGLPPTPMEALSSDAVQVDWVTLNPGSENSSSAAISTNPTSSTPAPIVEAQGWVIDPNREVVLTASAVPVLPHSSWQTPANCNGS